MSHPDDELARDAERLLGQVEDLHRLESQKRQEPISSPRFHELADAVVAKAREIMYRAHRTDRTGKDPSENSTSEPPRASSGATGSRSSRS